MMNIYLYDRYGRNHGKIIKEYTLQHKGTVVIPIRSPFPEGVYILWGTVHHLSGKYRKFKLAFRIGK